MDLIEFKPKVDYPYDDYALTLGAECLGENAQAGVETSYLNDSGWTITAVLQEDWFYWVNDFTATHPIYGEVRGNFEETIEATSKEAFDHFYKNHTPESWDYRDI